MRIGIDARFYGSVGKGLGRYTQKLLEHLERFPGDDEFVVFLRKENFDEYQPGDRRFKKVLAHFPWYGFLEQLVFPFVLFRHRLDLMHFPHFNVPLFYRKRFVVTLHDLILLHYPTLRGTTRNAFVYWLKYAMYRVVIASATRRAERIITVSQFTKHDLAKLYPAAAQKIIVTYEAADPVCAWRSQAQERAFLSRLELVKCSEQDNAGAMRDIIKPFVLYVGNAYPHKNLEAVIDVAAALPQYEFVLVGKEDYFYSRLKEKAREQTLPNVRFAGFVDDQDLNVLYRHARLYVFPSLYEGFGLPPLEAMSCGTPVLASNRASLPEVLGLAAQYFDPSDSESFRYAVVRLMEDEESRSELRTLGYAQAARYSWREMARETLAAYQQTRTQ